MEDEVARRWMRKDEGITSLRQDGEEVAEEVPFEVRRRRREGMMVHIFRFRKVFSIRDVFLFRLFLGRL